MRILLIPHTGLKKIHGDSNYILFLDLAEHLIAQGHFCYMLLPRFAQESVTRMPGLMYIYKDYEYDWYTESGLIDLRELADNFSRVVGKYYVDALVTAMPAQVPIYQLALSDIVRQRDFPCMTIDPSVYYLRDNAVNRISHVMTHFGYANSTTIFLSPKEKIVALENARKCLSPADVKKIDKTSMVLPVGVPCDYIDNVVGKPEKYDKFTLFFGARFNSVKNADKVMELYGKFLSSGKDCQIKMTTNTSETKVGTSDVYKAMINKYKDVLDIQYRCPRNEYLEKAARSHVAVAWSTDEGFPVGFWEQMYMGMPVLFHKKPWVTAQLPDWYPWVFSTMSEAYGMLLYIYENYDKVAKDMGRMQKFIRENYAGGFIHAEIEKELYRMINEPKAYTSIRSIRNLIKQCFPLIKEAGNVVSFDRIISILAQVGRSFPENRKLRQGQVKLPRDYDIYRMLLSLGYKDTCKQAKPFFIVPDEMIEDEPEATIENEDDLEQLERGYREEKEAFVVVQ